MRQASWRKGAIYALLCYILWGILPVYWKLLSSINSFHILGFRILLSLMLIACLLLPQKNTRWITILRDPKKRRLVIASSVMITANWGIYIWAVNAGHTVECSLGYYINPLISVLLGLIFFRERLMPLQWAAFGSAAIGVIIMTIFTGVFPWISIGLALTFGFYGLLKKKLDGGSLETLGTETLLASPAAILLLALPGGGFADIPAIVPLVWLPLILAGVITTVPLFFFAKGAKLLPLSAIGFLQIINPTLQLFSGVFLFGEPFPVRNLGAFAFIWASVILYSLSFVVGKKPVR
ncbi:membrane protein [Spirochaetia bacterium]|nr:membrane protein [Spirochaetia bacterium]